MTEPATKPYTALQEDCIYVACDALFHPEAGMIVMDGEEFLSAQEACTLLQIKPATLYAYVSRGLLRSYRQGIKRQRLYRRDEVEQLTRLRGHEGESDETPEADSRNWITYM